MRAPIDPAGVRRVAVRLTNWVGDCVMNTPFLALARRAFPNAEIAVLGRRNVAGLFEQHPDADHAWAIDDRSRAGYGEAVRRLRAWGADLGFALPNSLNSAAMLAFGRVRRRVGYARDARRFLLTDPVELRPQDLGVHEVEYYARLLGAWGVRPGDAPPLRLAVTAQEQDAMREWLAGRGIDPAGPVYGVNPAALYGTAKRYPAARWARAARALAEERGARVVVTGLPTERDVAQEVVDAGGPAFVNGAGAMKLRELMAFLSLCGLYLTNDSGAMHVAAALGAPVVAVFGSTDWVTTAPRSPNAVVVRGSAPCAPCLLRHCPIDHRCMESVAPEQVAAAARALLDKQGGRPGTGAQG